MIRAFISLLWFLGLHMCGPFRSIILVEHYDTAVLAGIAALTTGVGGPSALRGSLLFLAGILCLLFLDHDEGSLHPNKAHTDSGRSWMGLADHKAGVILLVVVLLSQVGLNSISTKLGSDLGGQKRLHALTTFLEGLILIPLAVIFQLQQEPSEISLWSCIPPILIVALCVFVMNFYIDSFCSQRLEVFRAARVGSIALFGFALAAASLWPQKTRSSDIKSSFPEVDHALSSGGVFACVLLTLASVSLTSDCKIGTKGSFVGYSETGVPLYNFRNSALHQTSKSMFLLGCSIVKQVLANHNSRKIFYFLCLNMCFTVVEFLYGMWTNSLGLISDAFHMLFDCSALIMGLVASVMATWKPSRTFSFGYGRIEDLSGFVNGLFLLVISFFVFTEAINRLFDPPNVNTNQLLAVSVAGLVVNLLGILAFRNNPSGSHGHSHGGGGSHGHSHNANMEGVFLHILADTFGSIGVITSSLMIEHFGWYIADPICSILIALLIFISVIPLLKHSARVLLLTAPLSAQRELTGGLKKILAAEGVLGVKEPHLWLHSSSFNVATLRVQVRPDASEQRVAQQVTAILKSLGFNQSAIQVEKDDFLTHLSGLGLDYGQQQHYDQHLFTYKNNEAELINVKAV